ncbi:MAG TPA: hypothetical protein VHE35_07460 [Kofleriaceae bacterium]|nr:hypothetical protein [Kofleriaceae bacterium]
MRFLFDCVEQLDLAVRQFEHEEHPTFARFALILVDNAVELLLYRYCEDELMMDDMMRRMRAERMSDTDRADARSQRVDAKLAFCQRRKVVSLDEAAVIRHAHALRNESYHAGVVREDVVRDIALTYYTIACDLLVRWPRYMTSWSSRDQVSPAVARHLTDAGSSMLRSHDAVRAEAVASLRGARPAPKRTLAQALAASLVRRIERLTGGLEFIADCLDAEGEVGRALYEAQLYAFLRGPSSPLRVKAGGKRLGFREYHDRVAEIRASWTPRFRTSPFPRFLRRAQDLRRERSDSRAIAKYERLVDEMEVISTEVSDAVEYFDAKVQEGVDLARGK